MATLRRQATAARLAGTAAIDGRRSPRWLVAALAALFALAVQGFAIQTHVHAGHPAAVATHADVRSTSGSDPLDCPRCRLLATAGAYLSPASPVLAAPSSSPADFAVLPLVAAVRRQRSHAWRSRGPPRPELRHHS